MRAKKFRRNRHKVKRKRCKLQQECRRNLSLHGRDNPVDGGSTFLPKSEYVHQTARLHISEDHDLNYMI
jgi:hypothetical protein